MHLHNRRNFLLRARAMWLIENRRNLQTVERLVTHDASIHQVRRTDLWIQTLGQLRQLLGFEIVARDIFEFAALIRKEVEILRIYIERLWIVLHVAGMRREMLHIFRLDVE